MRKLKPSLLIFLILLLLVPQFAFAASHVAKFGNKGKNVEEVQAMLSQMKIYRSSVDGEFGSKTLAAVKAFQKKYRKAQTGVVDKKLYELMSSKSGLDFRKYRKSWIMEATGYTAHDPGCTGITATGVPLRRGMIAVDPYIIPLGTQVYVVGYGKAIAADKGSAIKGNIIDLAFGSRGEALQWGRRRVRVYIL